MNASHSHQMLQLHSLFLAHWVEHQETIQHTYRCTKLIGEFGSFLGYAKEEIVLLENGAMFHDAGKLAIPPEILYARRPLTKDEFELIKTHPLQMEFQNLEPIVLAMKEQHHEHLDGTGYPRGLKGREIHHFTRILSIVDVYDALKYARSYKRAWTEDEIFEEMMKHRATRFSEHHLDSFFLFLSMERIE